MKLPNGQLSKPSSTARIAAGVDGKSIGFLHLDLDKLWAQVRNRKKSLNSIGWMDSGCYEESIRTAIILKVLSRMKIQLSDLLADEIVNAQREMKKFTLRSESAATEFGRSRQDIERLAADSGCSLLDFYSFFWKYLLDERDAIELRKEWKSSLHG